MSLQQLTAEYVNCQVAGQDNLLCNGTQYHVADHKLKPTDSTFWAYIGVYVLLVLGAGLMSGLTIGLMSLDLLSLQVLSDSGSGQTRRYAQRLFPIIRRHHWLLVTLLLGNAACVEAMPLFLDRVSDPITAVLVSVTAVLFFGEVIPQALCTRFGLAIGYYCSPIVYAFMALLSPVAYPLARLLDCVLGAEHETVFRREELKSLVEIHGPKLLELSYGQQQQRPEPLKPRDGRGVLTAEEVTVICGALGLAAARAGDACTHVDSVFMLSDSEVLTPSLRSRIAASAHSRVPVFHAADRNDIRGHLLAKMLLLFPHDEHVPMLTVLQDPRCFREMPFVSATAGLYDLLKLFQLGKSHMAVVMRADQPQQVQGVITMENVLEKLLLQPIRDEADEIRDNLALSLRQSLREGTGRLSRQLSRRSLTGMLKESETSPLLPAHRQRGV